MTRSILDLADEVWNGRTHLNDIRDYPVDQLEEVAPGVMMAPGFGHAFVIDHGDGVALFDTGPRETAKALNEGVRRLTDKPLTHAVYSHGHLDHVFGVGPFDEEADAGGQARPIVIAHENVARRFERYDRSKGFNTTINKRQFRNPDLVWPAAYRMPDIAYVDVHTLSVGDLVIQLKHCKGETDDHTVGWIPERKILFPGDLFLGVAPNAGNPQKVQRFAEEWAAALRWMAGLGAEYMLGSHGVPVVGEERIRTALTDTAQYLETIVEQTLAIMNAGGTVLEAIHDVEVPAELAQKWYLQPVYDEPEFIVRNIWRRYAGWYDGDPAHLKPARSEELAAEIAALAGGPDVLAGRSEALAEQGDLRLAGHLAQLAVQAAPDDPRVHAARETVYAAKAKAERSTMAKGIYAWAAAESRAVTTGGDTLSQLSTLAGRRPVSL
ncbi:alkyl sulfatase dimerization domain-containing protein [Aeromicrobium sp.]|uniref:alkyl sulfatase dimerization domain-containing protein n=1 Tax=Aeromicrobium sp. TaxID=1871063 RepID=UPI0028A7DC3E|nr:alkyl sulfatase dimerization domain-containing protein [Aeromicrobium sp.]